VCSGLNALSCSDPNDVDNEVCNTADDDCDGTVDEGTNACGGACVLPRPPGGPCDGSDTDFCFEGTFVCDGRNALLCNDPNDVDVETCNGADDDCNGTADDGSNACGGVCGLTGSPGAPCDGTDADACDEGTYFCVDLNDIDCNDPNDADTETCNGTDDDCNGTIDDGGGNGCGGVCTLPSPLGGPCDGSDADLCNEGTNVCSGPNNVSCTDPNDVDNETCNSIDDNCNGQVDEGGVCASPCGSPCYFYNGFCSSTFIGTCDGCDMGCQVHDPDCNGSACLTACPCLLGLSDWYCDGWNDCADPACECPGE
jgi:hypothetical protein